MFVEALVEYFLSFGVVICFMTICNTLPPLLLSRFLFFAFIHAPFQVFILLITPITVVVGDIVIAVDIAISPRFVL